MQNSSEKHVSTGGSNTVLADSASPERRSTQFDGRKAMIIGNHPHKGATATCQGLEVTNVGPGLVFKNDNTYEEFFVFKPENVMLSRNIKRKSRCSIETRSIDTGRS